MSAQAPTPAERALWAIEYAALGVVRLLILPLSPSRRISAAAWFGRIVLAKLPITRRRITANLALAMPNLSGAQTVELIRAVGDNFGRVLGEYECLDVLATMPERYPIGGPGLEAVRRAQATGKGAVLVSAHFGSWEAIRIALKAEGINCAMIYRAFNNQRFDTDVRAKMVHAGAPVLTKGRKGMRSFVGHIAKGGVALILVDQKQTGAPLLPFLGQPAETVLAAADLATRYDALLVPAVGRRAGDGQTVEVTLEDPIPDGTGVDRMTAVNDRISAWIRDCPGQWFWLHRRWRTRANPTAD